MTDTRRRTRNRLYLVGILPSLLLLLVAARISLVLQAESSGQAAYARGDFARAQGHFSSAGLLNPFERWVSPFDEGVAQQRAEDLTGAVGAYEAALRHVPESWECAVRGNLALAHETFGDVALEAEGRIAAEQSWTRGREALADCLALELPHPDDGDRDEVARQRASQESAVIIDERLATKLVDARTETAPDPVPPVPPEDNFAERERRLEERERRSLAERREQQQAEQEQQDRPDPGEPPPVPTW